jgi:hypothetical protein
MFMSYLRLNDIHSKASVPPNNTNVPEQSQVIGELPRLPVSGD